MEFFEKIRLHTTATLEKHNVPVHPHLPLTDATVRQSRTEVVNRMVALRAVAGCIEGLDPTMVIDWLKEQHLYEELTEQERRILETSRDGNLSVPDENQGSWKGESTYALAWTLGVTNVFPWPLDGPSDPDVILPLLPPATPYVRFLNSYQLIDHNTIVGAMDLYYCLDASMGHPELWPQKVVDPQSRGRVTARRLALEWICTSEFDWDEVPLDT